MAFLSGFFPVLKSPSCIFLPFFIAGNAGYEAHSVAENIIERIHSADCCHCNSESTSKHWIAWAIPTLQFKMLHLKLFMFRIKNTNDNSMAMVTFTFYRIKSKLCVDRSIDEWDSNDIISGSTCFFVSFAFLFIGVSKQLLSWVTPTNTVAFNSHLLNKHVYELFFLQVSVLFIKWFLQIEVDRHNHVFIFDSRVISLWISKVIKSKHLNLRHWWHVHRFIFRRIRWFIQLKLRLKVQHLLRLIHSVFEYWMCCRIDSHFRNVFNFNL